MGRTHYKLGGHVTTVTIKILRRIRDLFAVFGNAMLVTRKCCPIALLLKHYAMKDSLCGLAVRFLATDPEVQVRFSALPDFLRSSGS
jgi:hypothetical protein